MLKSNLCEALLLVKRQGLQKMCQTSHFLDYLNPITFLVARATLELDGLVTESVSQSHFFQNIFFKNFKILFPIIFKVFFSKIFKIFLHAQLLDFQCLFHPKLWISAASVNSHVLLSRISCYYFQISWISPALHFHF